MLSSDTAGDDDDLKLATAISSWLDWVPSWLVNYNSFEETENEDLETIALVAGYNVLLAFLFWLYWTWKRWDDPGFFSPKRAERPPDLAGPREGLMKWVVDLYRISEEEFLRFAGFDALVYVRTYTLGGKMCCVVALYAIPIILPINYLGDSESTDNKLSKMSMSNVSIGSSLLWAHVVGMYFLTAVCLFLLKREFRAYIKLRQRYLQQRKPHMRTIMLDVPRDARSNAILESYFGYLYPDCVLSAVCTQDLHVLRGLLAKRLSVVTRLERAELKRRKSKGDGPKMWTGWCWGMGNRVDAVGHLTEELNYYNTEVSREQAKRLHHLRKIDQRALDMASRGTLQQAIQAIMAHGGGQMLDDEETGLVEQLLRRSSTSNVAGLASAAGAAGHEYDPEAVIECGATATTTASGGTGAGAGAAHGAEPGGNGSSRSSSSSSNNGGSAGAGGGGAGLPRRRMGPQSSVLERDEEEDDLFPEVGDEEEMVGGKMFMGRGRRRGAGRGLGALISGPFGAGEVAEGPGETRPLLGRTASSASIKMINFPEMTPRAFVTFKTFSAATVARQVLHGAAPGRMAAEESPEPRDIYWFNTGITRQERGRRRILVESFLLLLYVFYVVPVTLLYLLLSADSVTSYADWVKTLYDESTVFSALVQSLQPMALLAMMEMLPPLIRVLGMLEGFPAESRNQQAVLSRYFYFQIINVFLVTTIAGTLLDTISEIVDEPTKTFTLLGESLPKVTGFFVEYIVLKMFAGLWLELTRTVSFMQEYALRLIWPRETPRDRCAVVMGMRPYFAAGWFNYPKYMAQDLLVVVVCLTYAIINPFILIVGTPYFFFCHLMYKHQMLYIYEPLYETGGVFFPKIFRRFIFAIIIAQATMVGVLILKVAYYEAALVFILMFLTYIAKSSLRGSYEPSALSLPLEIAKVLDDVPPPRRLAGESDDDQDADACKAYLQPSLKAEPIARPELERDHQANIDFERYRGRI